MIKFELFFQRHTKVTIALNNLKKLKAKKNLGIFAFFGDYWIVDISRVGQICSKVSS